MPSPFMHLSPGRARALDRHLDKVVVGLEPGATDLDPGLAAAVVRLHTAAFHRLPGANSAATPRLAPAGPGPSPAKVSAKLRPVGRLQRNWACLQWATTALLLLALVGGTLAIASRQAGRQDAPSTELYRSGRERSLTRLDPLSLRDLDEGKLSIALRSQTSTSEDLSATPYTSAWYPCDGARDVLRVDSLFPGPPDFGLNRYEVRDGRSGDLLALVAPPSFTVVVGLSADCTRLVLAEESPPPARWSVYDAISGDLITTVEVPGEGLDSPSLPWTGVLDPAATRIYRLIFGRDVEGWRDPITLPPGPYPVALSVVDIASGGEVARIELPDVKAGYWATHQAVPWGGATLARVAPKVVVSPDGGQVAVVHADGRKVEVVDTAELRLARTIAFDDGRDQAVPDVRPPNAFGDDSPEVGSGFVETSAAEAAYSADGTNLYVSGYDAFVTADGQPIGRLRPLVRLDLATGTVAATAPEGTASMPFAGPMPAIVPSTDGGGLYLFGPLPSDLTDPLWTGPIWIRRLDPVTLQTEAERKLSDGWIAFVLP